MGLNSKEIEKLKISFLKNMISVISYKAILDTLIELLFHWRASLCIKKSRDFITLQMEIWFQLKNLLKNSCDNDK
jgi:hypothetical protein